MINGHRAGIAISSYVTNDRTLLRLRSCVQSLLRTTSFLDAIYIIDDASPLVAAKRYYEQLPTRVEVVYHERNKGIGRTKNHSLDLLKGFDVIILADNDIEFRPRWDYHSLTLMMKAGIKDMALSGVLGHQPQFFNFVNGVKVGHYANQQGALMYVTRDVVQAVGGFPCLPEKYGQEHAHWQHRISKHCGHEGYVLDIGLSRFIILRHDENSFTTKAEKERMSIANGKALCEMVYSEYLPLDYSDPEVVSQEGSS